jgi:hypothetical protein
MIHMVYRFWDQKLREGNVSRCQCWFGIGDTLASIIAIKNTNMLDMLYNSFMWLFLSKIGQFLPSLRLWHPSCFAHQAYCEQNAFKLHLIWLLLLLLTMPSKARLWALWFGLINPSYHIKMWHWIGRTLLIQYYLCWYLVLELTLHTIFTVLSVR